MCIVTATVSMTYSPATDNSPAVAPQPPLRPLFLLTLPAPLPLPTPLRSRLYPLFLLTLPAPLPPLTPLPLPPDLPCIAPSAEGDSIDYFTNVLRQRQLNVGENLAEYIMGEWGLARVLLCVCCAASEEKKQGVCLVIRLHHG